MPRHTATPPTEVREQPVCSLCSEGIEGNLGVHIRQVHGEEALRNAVLNAKEQGMPDVEIGARYGVSFNTLQQIVTEAYGANISVLKRPKRIKRWEPPNFREETTTVWSYRQRGDWATHNGRYRGNWSPYIPRNVILKYSRRGDTVLDYFVGGGTTAVEAKLLGRHCVARDINPGAVGITLENLKFEPARKPYYEPKVSVGDARDLSDISDNSVDLICAHPPYAGIIKYGSNIPGDLSDLTLRDFLVQMGSVAQESLRVLKSGGKCAILIGDGRKSKHVVPIGFQTIRVFLDSGFTLKELVIKRQHKCKTTGFWYRRSIKYNFLLLAHEYLPIFEKPTSKGVPEQLPPGDRTLPYSLTTEAIEETQPIEAQEVETTTVWILAPDHLNAEIRRNLARRFVAPDSQFVEIAIDEEQSGHRLDTVSNASVIYVSSPGELVDDQAVSDYRLTVRTIAEEAARILPVGGFLVVDTADIRVDDSLAPVGLMLYEDLLKLADFAMKEIVMVVPEDMLELLRTSSDVLRITHRYLLVYRRRQPPEG